MFESSDLASELSPVVTAIGVVVALLSARQALSTSRSKNRADWMFQAIMTFHRETKLYDLFHKIDYEQYEFSLKPISEGGDLGSESEKTLIFFLDFLNGVCAAYEAEILDEEYLVMSSLGYAVQRTANNAVIKAYLDHLKQHDEKLAFNRRYSFGRFRKPRRFRAFEHFRDVSHRIEGLRSQKDFQDSPQLPANEPFSPKGILERKPWTAGAAALLLLALLFALRAVLPLNSFHRKDQEPRMAIEARQKEAEITHAEQLREVGVKRAAQDAREDTFRPRFRIHGIEHTKQGFMASMRNVGQMTATNLRMRISNTENALIQQNTLAPGEESKVYFEYPGGPREFEIEFDTEYRTVFGVSITSQGWERLTKTDRTNTFYAF